MTTTNSTKGFQSSDKPRDGSMQLAAVDIRAARPQTNPKQVLPACESAWSRYIDSRLKQFAMR